ncbi:MAG: nickel-dependent hydrogenase large subunit [Thermofilaceae archaeon]
MSIYLPIGPQHPVHPEAVQLKLKVEGEEVVDADVDVSFVHRGIEKVLETKTYVQGLFLAERICGICNVAHTTCYAINVERLAGVEVPRRALYLRLVVEELARMHSHMLWLSLLAHVIGFDSLFMLAQRDRELVLDLIEEITGGRVITSYNVIGGVRRNVDAALAQKIISTLDGLRKRVLEYKRLLEEDAILRARTEDVGYLSSSKAVELSAVGPVARASGVPYDVRECDPYLIHDEVPFNVVVYDTCDVWGRAMVRIDEVLESIEMIRYALERLPEGDVRAKVPLLIKPPPGESVARVEAPRGELIHYVRSDGSEKPVRYKVRTPTLANLAALVEMLKTGRKDRPVYVADVPVIFASIDPCICCAARVLLIDEKRGSVKEVGMDEVVRGE